MKPQAKRSFRFKILLACLLTILLFSSGDLEKIMHYPFRKATDFTRKLNIEDLNKSLAFRFTKSLMTQVYSVKDTGIAEGYALIYTSDCYTCHADNKILLAPSFSEIAARYKNDKDAIPKLANKVIVGSVGTWGDRSMPPHPEFLQEDAQKMIKYILNLNKQSTPVKNPDKRN